MRVFVRFNQLKFLKNSFTFFVIPNSFRDLNLRGPETSSGRRKPSKTIEFFRSFRLLKYRNQKGYTLVETLVAIAILMAVLVPATLFLGKITANQKSRDLIVASQLAREEMERTTAYQLYENDKRTVNLNHKNYQIIRSIENQSGLIHIAVQVTKREGEDPLVELKTMRIDMSF